MKSKYETLKSIIKYVENESNDVVAELLEMGFTPCQLVYEFGFDEQKVKASELYTDSEDLLSENLDETKYPFVLSNYNSFDAALVNWFQLSKDSLLSLKSTKVYKDMKAIYDEEKIEVLTDITNDIFDKFFWEVTNSVEINTLKREE